MSAIGHLKERIDEQGETVVATVEPMLQQHILHEISSPQPFLRAKACWVYGEFCNIKNEAHLIQATEAIFQQVFAPELPVKLAAALAL